MKINTALATLGVFLFVVTDFGQAQAKINAKLCDYYSQISGVWQISKEIKNDGEGIFSWGRSQDSVASLLIDLGDNRPYIAGPGQLLVVDAINRVSSSVLKVSWHDLEYGKLNSPIPQSEHMGVLTIHLESKDKIWLEWDSGYKGGDFRLGIRHPYFRTAGPK